ncbi:hypothetical protein [Parabacteroides faecis]|uniref:hypothetical protein n=1 Tax=Parabacteroides faecis TaxID=1217282 RepID=UPI003521535E
MFIKTFFSRLFSRNNKIEYTTGEALSFEDIYLPELEKYPIWIYALDNEEDYDENQDESWLEPITNSTNITKQLAEAYKLLKVKENGSPAFGHLDIRRMQLDDLWFWDFGNKDWIELRKLSLPSPIHRISVPSIMDQAAVEFTYNKDKDTASRFL